MVLFIYLSGKKLECIRLVVGKTMDEDTKENESWLSGNFTGTGSSHELKHTGVKGTVKRRAAVR